MGFEGLLFIVGYMLVLVCAICLFYAVGLSLRRPSIPMVFFCSYLVFAYLGALPIYLGWDLSAGGYGVPDQGHVLKTWFYSSMTLLLVCSGFVYSRVVLGIKPRTLPRPDWERKFPKQRIWMLFLISFMALALYIRAVPGVALIARLQGADLYSHMLLRSEATNALATYWRYALFTESLLPFLSDVLWAAYLIHKRPRHLLAFLVVGSIALFAISMNLKRSGPVYYVAHLVFVYLLVKQTELKWRSIFLLLIMFGLVVLGVVQFRAAMSFDRALNSAMTRVFASSFMTSYYYLEVFPDRHEYLYGQGFPNPGGLLPFETFPLTKYMFLAIRGPKGDRVGSMPAPFWADLHANFGLIGVLIGAFSTGVGFWILHCWTTRWPHSSVHYALITYLTFYFQPATTSSLITRIFIPVRFSVMIFFAIFLVVNIWVGVRNSRSLRYNSEKVG